MEFDGWTWCWVRHGDSQLQARHVSHIVKMEVDLQFYAWLNDFMWHGLHVEDTGGNDTSSTS